MPRTPLPPAGTGTLSPAAPGASSSLSSPPSSTTSTVSDAPPYVCWGGGYQPCCLGAVPHWAGVLVVQDGWPAAGVGASRPLPIGYLSEAPGLLPELKSSRCLTQLLWLRGGCVYPARRPFAFSCLVTVKVMPVCFLVPAFCSHTGPTSDLMAGVHRSLLLVPVSGTWWRGSWVACRTEGSWGRCRVKGGADSDRAGGCGCGEARRPAVPGHHPIPARCLQVVGLR